VLKSLFKNTQTDIHTHRKSDRHTHTHTQPYTHTQPHCYTTFIILFILRILSLFKPASLSLSLSHTHTYTHTHTHTHTHTCTYTHTHTHCLPLLGPVVIFKPVHSDSWMTQIPNTSLKPTRAKERMGERER